MSSLPISLVNSRREFNLGINKEANLQKSTSTVTSVDIHEPIRPQQNAVRFFPWTASAAILFVIGSWAFMIAISVRSNNDLVTNWTIQPAVYFALATAMSNLFIRFAFTEGVAVRWWYKSSKDNQTLRNLHENWAVSNSFISAITSVRNFGILSAASIACALLSINAPLLQRSSTVVNINATDFITLGIPMAKVLPDGYTGITSGRYYGAQLMTPEFVQVMGDYNNRVSPSLPFGCADSCRTSVLGTGFTAKCNTTVSSFDSGPVSFANGSSDPGYYNRSSSTVFSISYSYNTGEPVANDISPVYISHHIVRKQKGDSEGFLWAPSQCAWNVINQDCDLLPAIVRYPVVITGNNIVLDPNSTYKDDQMISATMYPWQNMPGEGDTLGGIYLMLRNMFISNVVMENDGVVGWDAISSGNAAQQYLANSSNPYLCTWMWTDPTDDLLGTLREVMFRTSLKAAEQNSSLVQQVSSSRTRPIVVYQSSYLFLSLSITVSTVTTILVICLLHSWRSLGKKVTLSPVDTARLIDTHALRQLDAKADINWNLKNHGELGVRDTWIYTRVKSS